MGFYKIFSAPLLGETMSVRKSVFTAKNLSLAAMFAAVSFGLSFLEFPLFAAAPYLKLDISFSAQLIGAYILGPALGEIIVVSVQLMRLTVTSSGGVGEIANVIAATCYVLLPSLVYRCRKGLTVVFISLFVGSALEICASLLSNRFLVFPLYMGAGAKSAFDAAFGIIVAFNAIKCALNALITLLLYKRLKRLFFKDERDRTENGEARREIAAALADCTLDFGGKLKRRSESIKKPDSETGCENFN